MAGAAGKGQQFGKGSLMDVVGGWLNEMRYFYQRQVSVPLSPHAQALWCWMMYRASSVFWKFPLRLSVPEMAGCTKMSPAMVKKARAELVAGGYLIHEAYGGNKPGGYWIMSCVNPGHKLVMNKKLGEPKK